MTSISIPRKGALVALGTIAAAAAAIFIQRQSRRAERENPPQGQFIHVQGARLHFVDKGRGPPVVLLHGNGTMVQDFQLSGLLDLAATRYRVIAFDRPGYGYSTRPGRRLWTPDAQAELIHEALARLGIERPIVLGHSWGTLVALALASLHPASVKSLVLLSGYYFPTLRLDVPLASTPALPLVGHLLRHTVSPLLGRLMWPRLVRRMFGPSPTPRRFAAFPKWLSLRPSQLRAAAAEAALMVPAAAVIARRYSDMTTPTYILAGAEDRIVKVRQSERLHAALQGSTLRVVPATGHMFHYLWPRKVVAAIDDAAAA